MWYQNLSIIVLVLAVVSGKLVKGCCAASGSETIRDIFQVLRIEVRSGDDVQWLHSLRESLENETGADFWRPPSAIGQPVDVMLPEYSIMKLKRKLERRGMSYSVMIGDVYGLTDEQFRDNMNRRRNDSLKCNPHCAYLSYEEIRQWLKEFSNEHSDIAEEFVVTKSYEGRDVAGIKISIPNGVSKKRSVWIEGGIHAREWISPATVVYMAHQLVLDYKDGDTQVQRILNNLDFYIVPSLNVDGYAYTWKNAKTRLWRKTRSPNRGSICRGTDGNRNWPYEWGGIRASTNPCNETFRGSREASEVEIQGVVDFTMAVSKKHPFVVFMDWHSYGQLWLTPWSYSVDAPPPSDAEDQLALAAAAVAAMKSVHQTVFTPGNAASTLYAASGYSIDWSYAVLKAKYSFEIELRDRGRYGFLLPADQILPSGEESYAGVKVVGKWVVDELMAGRL